VGTLDIGAQADIAMINPETLAGYECDPNRKLIYRDLFEHEQMVNRSDGVVTRVLINGTVAWEQDDFTPALGDQTLGRALRAA